MRVIGETDEHILAKDPKSIRKVIFCTGKVYYDIVTERAAKKIDDVAVVRLEQISPFPFDLVS
jgi:2-oxoglutarate dehydrogenase E1 component